VNGTRKEKSSFFHWKNLEVKKHFAVELNVKMLQINLSWSLSSVNNLSFVRIYLKWNGAMKKKKGGVSFEFCK
jgi:hypothetical protein